MIKRNNFDFKIRRRPFKAILVAEAHLAERQFLLAEDTLNMGKSLICRTGTRRPTIIIIIIIIIINGEE
jgi:hypothetical protein